MSRPVDTESSWIERDRRHGRQRLRRAGADNYPAALSGVTAAGGATLAPTSDRRQPPRLRRVGVVARAAGWGGGSGCDLSETKPSYQTDTGCTGRSYADVSADATPTPG